MSQLKPNFKLQASQEIKKLVLQKSQCLCGKIVRMAIQQAKNIPVQPTGISSAKDFGPWLEKQGYSIKPNQSIQAVQPGNIIIIAAIKDQIHGHIAILCSDGQWRSDFIQKSYNPFDNITTSQLMYTLYE